MKNFYLLLLAFTSVQAQITTNMSAKFLDKNKVKARIYTVNNKFWNVYSGGSPSYEVPKGKGTNAQFANSIWIGGLDALGHLHVSANTYRQIGVDFWPGPLDTTNINAFNTSNSTVYNKPWKVDCDDINSFASAYSNGSVSANTYTIPTDIATYPGRGISNFQRKMEPFFDANNNGIYNPLTDGDYPIIKGHQQILTIYHDNYTIHSETKAPPMGLEIHEKAYAYFEPNLPDSMQAVNYTTFYHYTIYNRSNLRYSNVYIGDWSDVDLGYYADDYIGTDTVNNFAYSYNGDNYDENSLGYNGYGNKPPVVSHAILKTSCTSDGIDNDQDGFIDESGEQFLMNRTIYYNNNISPVNPAMVNPDSAIHYYRFLSGKWKNGASLTFGGSGFGGSTPTKYVFPGNPATNSGWTETTAGNSPGDRRVIFSSGPFEFPANSKIEWGYAVVFSQDTSQNVNTITQFNSRVQRDVRNIRWYDDTHQNPQCLPPLTIGLRKLNPFNLSASIFPNPANTRVNIQLGETVSDATIRLLDVCGRQVGATSIHEGQSAGLDISELTAGIYFVELNVANSTITQKLVKRD